MNLPDLPYYTPRDLAPLVGISTRQMQRYFSRHRDRYRHEPATKEQAEAILKWALKACRQK